MATKAKSRNRIEQDPVKHVYSCQICGAAQKMIDKNFSPVDDNQYQTMLPDGWSFHPDTDELMCDYCTIMEENTDD